MRQLKFRAWHNIEKKWLFGYEYTNLGGFSLIGEVVLMGELNSVRLEDWCNVIIEQFTGLKDNNSVDIYEGDILGCRRKDGFRAKSNYIVLFDNKLLAFCIKSITDGSESLSIGLGSNPFSLTYEVIGNIHQTPELI